MKLQAKLIAYLSALILVILTAAPAPAQTDTEPLGIAMEGYEYPYPVQFLPLEVDGATVTFSPSSKKPRAAA